MKESLRILVIEDNPADVLTIRQALTDSGALEIRLDHEETLEGGLQSIADQEPDCVLLDLGLPDSQGLETLERFDPKALRVPVVVLTGLEDDLVGVDAVRLGAQDYVVKGRLTGSSILRIIRYGMGRKRTELAVALQTSVLETTNSTDACTDNARRIADAIRKFAGCQAVALRILDEDGNLSCQGLSGFEEGDDCTLAVNPLHLASKRGLCLRVLRREQGPDEAEFTPNGSLCIDSLSGYFDSLTEDERDRTRGHCLKRGFESLVLIPVRSGDRTLGLLHLADRRIGVMDGDTVDVVERVAVNLGTALARRQAEEALEQSRKELLIRNRIAQILLTSPGRDMYVEVLDHILDATGCRYGVFGYINEAGVLVCPSMTSGVWEQCQMADKRVEFPPEVWGGLFGRALNDRKSYFANSGLNPPMGHIALKNALAVPVLHDGDLVGLLMVGEKPDAFEEPDKVLLETIAASVAPILKARLQKEAKEVERKEAEEILRHNRKMLSLFMDSSTEGMAILDSDLNFLEVNEATTRILGQPREVFEGTNVRDLSPDAVRSGRYQKYLDVVRTGEPFITEDRLDHPSFGHRHLFLRAFRVGDGMGIILTDITERIHGEREKRKMDAQLRHQQKLESIGTLASGVAHEINNPINIIMNYAQLILDDSKSDGTLAENAGQILTESGRVADIVRNLLRFSRHERQAHSEADLNDVVEATLSLVRKLLARDQVEVRVDVPGDLPRCKCRTQQIQQVLMNLLTNARDALNERYPGAHEDKFVSVTASQTEQDGNPWLRLTVEDRGTGIPDDIAERVFDPFFTSKSRDMGTGLGLAISHGIVTEHRGNLSFETEPGRFTRFHVDLPVDNGWTLEESGMQTD